MVTELISFSFPAFLLMYRARDPKYLPEESAFNLGSFGWLVNILVVCWAAFLTIIFSFPVRKPVTAGSMSGYNSVDDGRRFWNADRNDSLQITHRSYSE